MTLKVKFNDFEIITRSRSVPVAVSSRSDLERLSIALLQNEMPRPQTGPASGCLALRRCRGDDQAEPQLGAADLANWHQRRIPVSSPTLYPLPARCSGGPHVRNLDHLASHKEGLIDRSLWRRSVSVGFSLLKLDVVGVEILGCVFLTGVEMRDALGSRPHVDR